MSNEYRLKSLKDEEILKLYELFFGPILMRRETKFYLESLKTFLNKDSSIEKVISRLNVLEIEIIKLLSQLTEVPSAFLNEKLSIILGEHPSLIGKTIQNLIVKNYIFTRDDKYLFIPELIANHYKNEGISAKKISTTEQVYNCEKFGDVINTIIYFLSKKMFNFASEECFLLVVKSFEWFSGCTEIHTHHAAHHATHAHTATEAPSASGKEK